MGRPKKNHFIPCTICKIGFHQKRSTDHLCSDQCIKKYIASKKSKYTSSQYDIARQLRLQGLPINEICAKTGIGVSSIKKFFHENKIKLSIDQYHNNATRRWEQYNPVQVDGTKQCAKCQQFKAIIEFGKDSKRISGLSSYCRLCASSMYIQNRDIIRSRVAQYRKKNINKIKQLNQLYYQCHTEKYINRANIWASTHKEERKIIERRSRQKNLAIRRYRLAMYRANKKQATPPWLSDAQKQEIKEIYKQCPMGSHVDHIVPLNGVNVSGLHVPWNLQCIPAAANEAKSNRTEAALQSVGTCYQYLRRLETLNEDIASGMSLGLAIADFVLQMEKLSDEHRQFIRRYEWLGNIGFGVKWVFVARHNGHLGGVVMLSEPTSYSSFGMEYEVLIQRGACAAWAPKNLGSHLISFACRWMLKNTTKRLFVAYADPEANEIGTIYQACNFEYLGAFYGAKELYQINCDKWVSARYFTRTNSIKKWAQELGIIWQPEWTKTNGFQDVQAIPRPILQILRDYGKKIMYSLPCRRVPSKGKYVLLLWKNKYEKRQLLAKKTWSSLPYPKRLIK